MATSTGRRRAVAALCLAPLLSLGCAGWLFARVPVKPPPGLLYTHHSAPASLSLAGRSLGSRTGTAQASFLQLYWPLVTWGDASIEAAARDGGLQSVQHADYEVLSILGIYVEHTIRVYGD
jgi:hypothetical protein